MPSTHVARQLDTSQDTVRLWRRRCAAGGPDAWRRDAPGRGRKRQITAAREQQVVEAPLHRAPPRATQWSLRSMAATQGLRPASIHRIRVAHGLQPHRVRTFTLSTDPAFVEQLTDVVGLYVNPPDKALVVCVDEKSQIHALQRSQPGLPLKPGRAGTLTHDDQRHGTTTLFAALNVLEGTVIGSCHARHRQQEFRNMSQRARRRHAGRHRRACHRRHLRHAYDIPRFSGGCSGIRASTSIAFPRARRGSISSKSGSPISRRSRFGAGTSSASATSLTRSRPTSITTINRLAPSSGPRPPSASWRKS